MLIDSKEIAKRTGESFRIIRIYMTKIFHDGDPVFPQSTTGSRGGKNLGIFWESDAVDQGYKRILAYREQAKKDKINAKNKRSEAVAMDIYRKLPSNHKLVDQLFNKSMSR